MQQYRNNRNNGNFYDLRKDLQHTPPPSQQKGSSGSADGRYGFNGEPLSFAPDGMTSLLQHGAITACVANALPPLFFAVALTAALKHFPIRVAGGD